MVFVYIHCFFKLLTVFQNLGKNLKPRIPHVEIDIHPQNFT